MAVRASNLAIRDLRLKAFQADPTARQLDHVAALRAHMIDVEHDEPGFAAIHTGGPHWELAQIFHVAAFARSHTSVEGKACRVEAPRAVPSRSPDPMTIDADDLAVPERLLDTTKRRPGADQVGDI